jgi:hypothetical protein
MVTGIFVLVGAEVGVKTTPVAIEVIVTLA